MPYRKSTDAYVNRQKEINFNENDRKQINEILTSVKHLKEEIQYLKVELETSNSALSNLQSENLQLKQALNLTNFKLDSLEQYGRRENLRLHNILEVLGNKDDGETEIIKVAKELNVKLESKDNTKSSQIR